MNKVQKDKLVERRGYLVYTVENCLLALEELEKVNTELLKKFKEHKPINMSRTGSLHRIVQDYLILRVAGLFDEDTRVVSFFNEFQDDVDYRRIKANEIILYLREMRNKRVAHNDKSHLFKTPNTSKILQSNLRSLLKDLLKLLK